VLEGVSDDGAVDDLNLLYLFLEGLTVVLVPLSDLNVEDVVLEVLHDLEMLLKETLQVVK
jgi:hypothetical protein